MVGCHHQLSRHESEQTLGDCEAQAGIKIGEEISITSDMQMIPPLWQEV